jgi:hypothetical protein
MAEIKANLSGTWFAWSGPTTNGMPAYYRIQGPTVVIEYAPQPLGGDPTMHIHTIYRDPTNDYGKKSDTPRGAGGLMSWAASKAVVAFI